MHMMGTLAGACSNAQPDSHAYPPLVGHTGTKFAVGCILQALDHTEADLHQ